MRMPRGVRYRPPSAPSGVARPSTASVADRAVLSGSVSVDRRVDVRCVSSLISSSLRITLETQTPLWPVCEIRVASEGFLVLADRAFALSPVFS